MLTKLCIISTIFIVSIHSARLRCGNISQPVLIEPSWGARDSGVLITWDLLSPDAICTDPPRLPTFTSLRLEDVSIIAKCDECPKCSLRLPMKFEMPLSYSLHTIYILTKQVPFHVMKTDLDVRFVVMDKMPKNLRNCEVILSEKPKDDKLFTLQGFVLFGIAFFTVFICLCFIRCLCSRIS